MNEHGIVHHVAGKADFEISKYVRDNGLRFEAEDSWDIEGEFIGPLESQILYHSDNVKSNSSLTLYTSDLGLSRVYTNGKIIRVNTYAHSTADTKALIRAIRIAAPEQKKDNEKSLNVRFWYNGPQGPVSVSRKIDVPTWNEIEVNYARDTRTHLTRLYDGFKPSHGGQVILWHGHPGTGKTYALRALGYQWRDWASAEYIMDPEILFGGSPSYLTSLLLDASDNEIWDAAAEEYVSRTSDMWKLLIMEDTGELITEDAKERTGQGLSRLLNLADGILGQGLKVLILITTNEPLSKLHPAVSRPGRCAAVVDFLPLSQQEIIAWNSANNAKVMYHKERMLAELYAEKEEFEIKETNVNKTKKLGFALA